MKTIKKENHAVFFVVVYPGVEAYLPQFVASMNAQTSKAFDLCVFNDGLDHEVLNAQFASLNKDVYCQFFDISGTPASIRIDALNQLIQAGYEYAILGDSDDFFSANRVEKSLELLAQHDVVINELDITNEQGDVMHQGFLQARLRNGQELDEAFLRDKNVCGFSNAAINLQRLGPFDIEEHVLATDWFLFTYAVIHGLTMVFTTEAQTYYRQHTANYVGVGEVSLAKIEQTIRIKFEHYTGLVPYKSSYADLAARYAELKQQIAGFDNDADAIQQLGVDVSNTSLFWWEVI